jgi:hypothetical protein
MIEDPVLKIGFVDYNDELGLGHNDWTVFILPELLQRTIKTLQEPLI